jgi:phosphoribosylglycinamide formyltransferase-1
VPETTYQKHNIAIFASGTGSNAMRIMAYFKDHPQVAVGLVVSNKPDAPVLARATAEGVPTLVINRAGFYETEELLEQLAHHRITFIVLAGFLWLVPGYLVRAFEGRMVNIHPALLPAYGGKGMYGMRVHEAVKRDGAARTGITIHQVNEKYDEGQAVFQAECPVLPEDTPEDIARRVQQLEHQHFAPVLEQLLLTT